jgi:hypothetical protein
MPGMVGGTPASRRYPMRQIRLIDPGTPRGRTTGYHRQIAETSNER